MNNNTKELRINPPYCFPEIVDSSPNEFFFPFRKLETPSVTSLVIVITDLFLEE